MPADRTRRCGGSVLLWQSARHHVDGRGCPPCVPGRHCRQTATERIEDLMPSATVRVRVPFVDVDSSMRIHFTAMFRYMEIAEHELMRHIGMPYAAAFTDLAMPRV